MKLSELLENISDMDKCIKGHLNTPFHSKTGNLIWGQEYSKSFDEDVITRLDEAKKRVNSELKYLNKKLDQCKDMFLGVFNCWKTNQGKDHRNRTKGRAKNGNNREKVKIINCFISFCQQT